MFQRHDRVVSTEDQREGTVTLAMPDYVQVHFDDGSTTDFPDPGSTLRKFGDVPGPSAGDDPVHAAMLRHARNAGSAVTALEIIRREANRAVNTIAADPERAYLDALAYIEKFADGVLSFVLPA